MAATTQERLSVRALDHIEDHRVCIRLVDKDGRITADVGAYRIRRSPGGKWSRQCMAAVELVTTGQED